MRTEENKVVEAATSSTEPTKPELEPVVVACNENEAAFWRSIGLPYCDKCCSPRRTDEQGKTLCTLQLAPSKCPLQQT
jgi:hypothetical protein